MTKDDRGSLPIALLVSMVGILLSTLLVNTVVGQNTNTRAQIGRVAALNAAQTGLDVALAHIRASADELGNGLLTALPCIDLSGTVAAVTAAAKASYKVEIDYYQVDPQNRSLAWLDLYTIRCLSGAGVLSTPRYALLRSTGTYTPNASSRPTTRVLQGTYTFKTNDRNISGGLIHIYKTASTTDLCIDAGSGSPIAGTAVTMEVCSAGSVAQTWAYNRNLTLTLVSSITPTMPLGMCLDAGTPQALGKIVYLQPCAVTTLPQQQWSYNDSANFEGTSNGSSLNGFCFNVQSPNVAGSFLVLANTTGSKCRSGTNNVQNFFPEQTTGAGAAGETANQLVNFKQFGRCLDVTSQNVSATYLIAWQCKQAPNPANVTWNQKWTTPALVDSEDGTTGAITTNKSGVYCLKSPRSTARGQYVVIATCDPTALPENMTWKMLRNTGKYMTSYTIVDKSGYCLSPTDPTASNPDLYGVGQSISKIIVATCDGSTLQKWNAPPSILSALPLKDLSEN
ncbi:ricin-type beta-trefoil lectin domain protein [Cryptosporangium sp. NPDC048952]|uniref:RICIN domain-containing protein n=1 Tax=Cryptosporangium sp. NPDC048952 TaxID=3363961 RepID=UPI003713C521